VKRKSRLGRASAEKKAGQARYRESRGLPPKSTEKVRMKKIGKRGKIHAKADARTRRAYIEAHGSLCEICTKPGEHLHHVRTKAAHPNLRHDHRNLMFLCAACHKTAHDYPAWMRDLFRTLRPVDAEEIGIGAALELDQKVAA